MGRLIEGMMMSEHESGMAQEFDGGSHRLAAKDGRKTQWAPYSQFTYLDGWVGVTHYFTGEGEMILRAEEFCAKVGMGVEERD